MGGQLSKAEAAKKVKICKATSNQDFGPQIV
jgi:hypothetical protein